jgi:hypothetical protein
LAGDGLGQGVGGFDQPDDLLREEYGAAGQIAGPFSGPGALVEDLDNLGLLQLCQPFVDGIISLHYGFDLFIPNARDYPALVLWFRIKAAPEKQICKPPSLRGAG